MMFAEIVSSGPTGATDNVAHQSDCEVSGLTASYASRTLGSGYNHQGSNALYLGSRD